MDMTMSILVSRKQNHCIFNKCLINKDLKKAERSYLIRNSKYINVLIW